MKYSLQQIKRYVPGIDAISTKELVDRVWQSIAEVESVTHLAAAYDGTIVAKVEKIEPHPKSSKLVVTTVNIGEKKPVVVVTAAQNLFEGAYVPYIKVGAKVPAAKDENGENIVISVRSMVGIDSVGMLAAEDELGFSSDHNGIMILREEELRRDIVIGAPIAQVLELDDTIIEIENKTLTHRGDCFSAAGLAREIATLFSLEYVEPEWQKPSFTSAETFGGDFDREMLCSLKVDVKAIDAVDRYTGVLLDGIQVKQSPTWLRLFLFKHDVNAVNNVVDITNYVMLDYGQPMHAFDAATVAHKKANEKLEYGITVRHAKAGEQLLTLDDKMRILAESATVIADAKKPLALAGVIGGRESGITDTSTRIVLESAVFNKYAIRNTSMSLGIVTDASVVFSRTQDGEKTGRALLRAVHLLQELAGAIVTSQIADVEITKYKPETIVLSHKRVEEFLGISVSPVKIVTIMERLGFVVGRKNGMYSLVAPSWRPDVKIDEDVYEEIARMIGYKEIVSELPQRGVFAVKLLPYEQVKQESMRKLTSLGFLQTMNFSFVSKQLYENCQLSVDSMRAVVNAISPEVQYVRKQLTPGILQQLAKNQYASSNFGLFEFGKTSRKTESYQSIKDVPAHLPKPRFGVDELGLPIEDEHLVLATLVDSKQPQFFTLKNLLVTYLSAMGVHDVTFVHPDDIAKKVGATMPPWVKELRSTLKNGRTAFVVMNAEIIGIIGEPNTLVQKTLGLKRDVAVAEVSVEKIAQQANFQPVYREPSKYPTISEDYCFELPVETMYASVEAVYQSVQNIAAKEPTKKQVSHRVTYSRFDKQITEPEVKAIKEQLLSAMKDISGRYI
jgi:phenylalanyl-tRNA synthetase beta chain